MCHSGESQAEWFMDGLLQRLTDPHDAVGRRLLRDAVLYLVPNCNPDGTWRGHLRTNAAGVNLNRAWAEPCLEDSPEVFHIRRLMDEKGERGLGGKRKGVE
jgi:murein tripeptide amidase MpaA